MNPSDSSIEYFPHSKMEVCRFRTIPPIPALQAAISMSRDWSIEVLIAKIHDTILRETDGTQYLQLLQDPNPSHNLLLELADGCMLPTSESCAILGRDQLITVRLVVTQSKLRLGPGIQHILPRRTSSPSNLELVGPPTINSTDHHSRFWSHPSSSIHPSENISINPNPRFQLIDDRRRSHLIDQSSPSSHRDPGLSSPPGRSSFPFHPINPSTVSQGKNFNPSSRVLPIHSTSTEEQPYLPYRNISYPPISCPPGGTIALTSDVDPRLQSVGPQHDPNINEPSSSRIHQDLPGQQSLPTSFRSASASSQKPSQAELDRSLHLHHSLDDEIPRVRSHIAGLRKSAFRHYLSSDSSRSSSEERNSDASESDEFATFSRHARSLRRRTCSQSHAGGAHIGHFRPRRSGDSDLLSPELADRPAKKSGRTGRKSLASSSSSESDWEATGLSSRSNVTRARRKRREAGRFFRERSSSESMRRRSCPSKVLSYPVSLAPPSARRHHSTLHNVRVVIPLLPSLVSPAYLKRKMNVSSDLFKQAHPSPPTKQPLSQGVRSSSPSVRPLSQEIDPSPLSADTPSQDVRPASPQTHPQPNACTPSGRKPSSRQTSSSGRTEKSFASHSGAGLSSSSGRTTRSVYRIHIHDMMFKAASGKGPLRVPYSNQSSGLNDRSTLRQVAERLNLDFQTSWKLIIGDQVWLSRSSSQSRSRSSPSRPSSLGRLDGRIVRADWDTCLKTLGVFPSTNSNDSSVVEIKVIRNWDLHK